MDGKTDTKILLVSQHLVNDQFISDPEQKATTLSNQFQTIFIREDLSSVPSLDTINHIPYVGKFWREKILAIHFTDEANGEEKFSESADRSSVISLYLQLLAWKNLANCTPFAKFAKIFPLQIFPTYGTYYAYHLHYY